MKGKTSTNKIYKTCRNKAWENREVSRYVCETFAFQFMLSLTNGTKSIKFGKKAKYVLKLYDLQKYMMCRLL